MVRVRLETSPLSVGATGQVLLKELARFVVAPNLLRLDCILRERLSQLLAMRCVMPGKS
ncbi:MAG: hypothetical protein R3C56_12765 [Pirellulaceae bacterium]